MKFAEGNAGGSFDESDHPGLVCAAASTRTGALLDESIAGSARERLEGLAAALPELVGTLDPSCLDRISERLGGELRAQAFSEILLLSDKHLHLIQPLLRRPGIALLAVCPTTSSTGLVLSAIRARVAALEEEE